MEGVEEMGEGGRNDNRNSSKGEARCSNLFGDLHFFYHLVILVDGSSNCSHYVFCIFKCSCDFHSMSVDMSVKVWLLWVTA